jgi:hypothetical protein
MYYKIEQEFHNFDGEYDEFYNIKIRDITKSDVERLRPIIERIHNEHMEEEWKKEEDWKAERDKRRVLTMQGVRDEPI